MKALATALLKAQGKLRGVLRDSTNPHFKNRYASLESVIDTIRPVLQECGIVFIQAPGLVNADGVMVIATHLIHAESGESFTSEIGLPIAKRDPQGAGSAITYGCRYSLMAMLGLPPTDDDAHIASSPPPPEKRENPSNNKPTDFVEPTEYDENGQPVDNIPLGDRAVTKLSKALARPDFAEAQKELRACKSITHLQLWGSNNANRVSSYPPDWQEFMRGIYADHMADLRKVNGNGIRA